MIKKLLLDPYIFNYGMLVLGTLACLRFGFEGKWSDFLYWVFAAGITAVVTFGYKS